MIIESIANRIERENRILTVLNGKFKFTDRDTSVFTRERIRAFTGPTLISLNIPHIVKNFNHE